MSKVKEGSNGKERSAATGATMRGPSVCGPKSRLGDRVGWEGVGQRIVWLEDGELGRSYMQNFPAGIRIWDFVLNVIGSH